MSIAVQNLLDRSIPARAGESFGLFSIWRYDKVYPRACGGIGLVLHHKASDGNGF